MITLKKSYALAIIMAFLPIVMYIARPTQKMTDLKEKLVLEEVIPQTFADWRTDKNSVGIVSNSNGDNVYDQVLSRTYVNTRGDRIMLSLAYGSKQTHDLKVHQQEVCYKAQGFIIEHLLRTTMNIDNFDVPVTRMFAIRKDHNEQVTYWFTIGSNVISDRAERFITVLKYLFSGIIADGYLIRVSSVVQNYSEASYQLHDQFIHDLIQATPGQLKQRLLGLQ